MEKGMNRPLAEALKAKPKREGRATESFEAFSNRYQQYLASTEYWRKRRKSAAEDAANAEAKP
jgi:hypothetical protein